MKTIWEIKPSLVTAQSIHLLLFLFFSKLVSVQEHYMQLGISQHQLKVKRI